MKNISIKVTASFIFLMVCNASFATNTNANENMTNDLSKLESNTKKVVHKTLIKQNKKLQKSINEQLENAYFINFEPKN